MFKHILTRLVCCAIAITCCLANTEILNFRTGRTATGRGINGDGAVLAVSLIPGQPYRASIPLPSPDTLQHGENTATTIEYPVQLDHYLQNITKTGSWLCKAFVGGCSINTEKAWTARISWPATTPAAFNISVVVEGKETHDRTLRVDMRRTGVPIPPHSALSVFNRRSNHTDAQTDASLSNQTTDAPAATDQSPAPDGAGEALVFDILVEPLLFGAGVLPMGSWHTGVAIVATLIVGPVVASGLMKAFVESA